MFAFIFIRYSYLLDIFDIQTINQSIIAATMSQAPHSSPMAASDSGEDEGIDGVSTLSEASNALLNSFLRGGVVRANGGGGGGDGSDDERFFPTVNREENDEERAPSNSSLPGLCSLTDEDESRAIIRDYDADDDDNISVASSVIFTLEADDPLLAEEPGFSTLFHPSVLAAAAEEAAESSGVKEERQPEEKEEEEAKEEAEGEEKETGENKENEAPFWEKARTEVGEEEAETLLITPPRNGGEAEEGEEEEDEDEERKRFVVKIPKKVRIKRIGRKELERKNE